MDKANEKLLCLGDAYLDQAAEELKAIASGDVAHFLHLIESCAAALSGKAAVPFLNGRDARTILLLAMYGGTTILGRTLGRDV